MTDNANSNKQELLKPHKSHRAVLLAQQTKLKNQISSLLGTLSVHQLEAKLALLEVQYRNFNEVQTKIEQLDEEESVKRDIYEEGYCLLQSRLRERIEDLRPRMSIDAGISHSTFLHSAQNHSVSLPKLQLPKFSGVNTEWLDFISVFDALVHSNHSLSNVERFQHLRSCLAGPAASLIQSLENTGENYDKALTLLKHRYDNKRHIFESHIEKIHKTAALTKSSVSEIRGLIDIVNANLRAIQSIATTEQIAEGLLVHLISSKLDSDLRSRWEDELASTQTNSSSKTLTCPTWESLAQFLERRCQTMSLLEVQSVTQFSQQRTLHQTHKSRPRLNNSSFTATTLAATTENQSSPSTCALCNTTPWHNPFMCSKFKDMQPINRYHLVRKLRLCLNCFKSGHSVKTCPSSRRCQRCQASHHTLLHRNASPQPGEGSSPLNCQEISSNCNKSPSSTLQANCAHTQTILATALIRLTNNKGVNIIGRALLDSASQLNFVSEHIAQFLGLKRRPESFEVKGIGTTATLARSACEFQIQSMHSSFTSTIEAVVLSTIASAQPQQRINTAMWNIPSNTPLADPTFNNPGQIDVLLGAGLFFDLMQVGQIRLGDNLPIMQKTTLGWVISGIFGSQDPSQLKQNVKQVHYLNINKSTEHLESSTIEQMLHRLWEVEDIPTCAKLLSKEETECEEFFVNTTIKSDKTNKFTVRLPFREGRSELGHSYEIARSRFLSVEARLQRDHRLRKAYHEFIHDYIVQGHMTKISREMQCSDRRTIDAQQDLAGFTFLPHHGVLKIDSSTTKLRVVFDASCPTTSGKSLNNILKVGPTLQDDVFSILLRFRTHKIVVMADVTQMYRQIWVHPDDRSVQCILWRDHPNDTIEAYQLNTVTYGTSSAPYLAVRCLRQAAENCIDSCPLGAMTTLRDFYVDNLMTGSDDFEEICRIKQEIIALLHKGGFALRKWASNRPDLLQDMSDQDKEPLISLGDTDIVKALGIHWDPAQDLFRFTHKESKVSKHTKRGVLSQIAAFYDPLGLLSPVIVKAKILLQTLWKLKLHWDESLPQDVHQEWVDYRRQFQEINRISIPRYVPIKCKLIQLHGFSDASSKAYGACVYLRSVDASGRINSTLVSAKSRVAPVKQISIPRLELCAAVLLTHFLDQIERALQPESVETICWTDSTITLAWVTSEPHRWTTFVANRVAQIQGRARPTTWRYVPSEENPADLVSRGASPAQLRHERVWFQGPAFLQKPEEHWPTQRHESHADVPEHKKSTTTFVVISGADFIQTCKYHNNYSKLIRIVCFARRFIHNSRFKEKREVGTFSPKNHYEALLVIVHVIQHNLMAKEIHDLESNRMPHGSPFGQLTPFLDNGIIRVGGRLSNSNLPYDAVHPMLLPKAHPFVTSLIQHFHEQNMHAGVQTLQNLLRERFWIIGAKGAIKSVLRKCLICFRSKPKLLQQIMGSLPRERVRPSRAFEVTGIDYCGPLLVTAGIRGRAPYKVYLALFVCFATKAVHLDLVLNLSTAAFVSVLKRFVARRGLCSRIYSDNATNFVGASRELKEMHQIFTSEQHNAIIRKFCDQRGIEWSFIPPRSPHFGGLWESAVKSAKMLIKKTIGSTVLPLDEMYTVCCQAEAVMNSRPISPVSNDPNDLAALTPGHFIIGRALTAIPEPAVNHQTTTHVRRHQHLQYIQQTFWKRWSREYLNSLQQRKKWTESKENLATGDLVLMKEDGTPPLTWPTGRIVETYPGDDGHVRVAKVRTKSGVYIRAITKLCKLPLD